MIKMMVIQKAIRAKNIVKTMMAKKFEGADGVVVALVLAAVAVGLCIYFRNGIYTIITSAITSLTTAVGNLLRGTVSS